MHEQIHIHSDRETDRTQCIITICYGYWFIIQFFLILSFGFSTNCAHLAVICQLWFIFCILFHVLDQRTGLSAALIAFSRSSSISLFSKNQIKNAILCSSFHTHLYQCIHLYSTLLTFTQLMNQVSQPEKMLNRLRIVSIGICNVDEMRKVWEKSIRAFFVQRNMVLCGLTIEKGRRKNYGVVMTRKVCQQ